MLRAPAVLCLLVLLTACGSADPNDSDAEQPEAKPPTPIMEPATAGSVRYELSSLADTAEAVRAESGAYPADLDHPRFREAYLPSEGVRVRYQPSDDGGRLRLCVRSAEGGSWATWDSAEGGLVALGDKGRCSFRAPDPATELGVRADLWRLSMGPAGDDLAVVACDGMPSTKELRAAGVLSAGNSVAACTDVDYQDGDVTVSVYCVQHGDDGAWATYDEVVGVAYASGGACLADLEDGDGG